MNIKELSIGDIVYHVQNRRPYKILGTVQVKIHTGEWRRFIKYESTETKDEYARSEDNFLKRFSGEKPRRRGLR